MLSAVYRLSLLMCLVVAGATASWGIGFYPFDNWSLPLTAEDFTILDKVVQPLLNDDSIPIGTVRSWSNPTTGNNGTVTLMQRFDYNYQGTKLPCRKLTYVFHTPDVAQHHRYALNQCRINDGSWKLLGVNPNAGQNRDGRP
jgi:hypothetical protein